MKKIYYQDKEIEVTGPEYDEIVGTLMTIGMRDGLNGKMYTPEESRKLTGEIIGEVLKRREEI